MSPLNSRRAMHPKWPYHQRSVPTGWMNATIEVFRRPRPATDYGFDPVTGQLTDGSGGLPTPTLIYRGQARAATNKDWRARVRTQRGDSGTVHAVRFQIPLANTFPVYAHDIVRTVECEPEPQLCDYLFHVRNPMTSSNGWLRNLLCDVDVAQHSGLPEPNTATLAMTAEEVPQPVAECKACG